MSRAEIIAAIETSLNFPGNVKRLAVSIDVNVLREAVRELSEPFPSPPGTEAR